MDKGCQTLMSRNEFQQEQMKNKMEPGIAMGRDRHYRLFSSLFPCFPKVNR